MKLYSQNKNYKLYQGNMLDMLEVIEPNSIDSIVTDPPYELNFMGKGWDNSGIAFQPDTWKKCYEVLKPGGHLLAFGGSRTFHRIACAIEDAGFEIRDVIMWLYGSGFPKSLNIGLAIDKKNGVDNTTGNIRTDGKATDSNSGCFNMNNGKSTMKKEFEEREAQNEWKGWGTQLKPSYEPIIVARKPVENTVIDNVIKYGVGGINIDECRVPAKQGEYDIRHYTNEDCFQNTKPKESKFQVKPQPDGRFPANTILTYDETDFDEVCGGFPITAPTKPHNGDGKNLDTQNMGWGFKRLPSTLSDNGGSAARYFYCAKASKKDRDEGLNSFTKQKVNDGRQTPIDNAFQRGETLRKNTHPTVKPTDLIKYLIRLVTPNGGTILDPFNGSGSTGKAAMYENREKNKCYKYIGIELTEEYLPISKARIEYATNPDSSIVYEEADVENKEIKNTTYKEVSLF